MIALLPTDLQCPASAITVLTVPFARMQPAQINLVILMLLIIIGPSHQTSNCPSACHQVACRTGVLSCSDGGLTEMPVRLPPDTSKIILSNHRFAVPHLFYANMSSYGPPRFRLIKLSIQNCALSSIAPNSFIHLSDLSVLDLSSNDLRLIETDTFRGLNLKFLRLDRNRNIILQHLSFRGLKVAQLSLIDCSLVILPFVVLADIAESLKQLILTDNKIVTLDIQLKGLFERLTVLQVNDNPFNCTCGIRWLSALLQWRKRHIDQSAGAINEAKCHGPRHLTDRPIADLSQIDFQCELPRLKLVDVYISSNNTARLTCSSDLGDQTSPHVQWFSASSKDRYQIEVESSKIAAVSVIRKQETDNFLCVITNENGNVTVAIKIKWPPFRTQSVFHFPDNGTAFDFDGSVSTDVEGFVTTSKETLSVLHAKKFTLLEMVGGVVGTFTLTMILFLCIYRYLSLTVRRRHKKKWYASYEAPMGSDSQTYDIPNNNAIGYYPGQLLSNHFSPTRVPNQQVTFPSMPVR